MGIRTVIPGPPGTGKTFRLVNHYLEKEINEYKTDPQKIIYITYFCKHAIIASPISEVETSFFPLEIISFVLNPSSNTF